MTMHIESSTIRHEFLKKFIDTESEYYKKYILKTKKYVDGVCYSGYLWDCFLNSKVVSEDECISQLKGTYFYLFWDIHSCENILIPDYWKYPKDCVLELNFEEYCHIKQNLPEDVYIYVPNTDWCCALTHEELPDGRFCYLAYSKKL